MQLGKLILTFYATSLLFVLVVLGAIAAWAGFSLLKFLRYIREELLIVLGTSSSESVLPQIMETADPAATLARLRKAALTDDTGAALTAAIKELRPISQAAE